MRARISAGMAAHEGPAPEFHAPLFSALRLRTASNAGAYLRELLALLRYHRVIHTRGLSLPAKPGIGGRAMAGLRKVLWRMCRYQHDYMAHQQNCVNELLHAALEFEHDWHQRELSRLQKELDELRAGGKEPAT